MPKIKYNQSSLWEEKYKTTVCEHYEWLIQPDAFLKAIQPCFSKQHAISQVLEIGCGTSKLALSFIKSILEQNTTSKNTEQQQSKVFVKCIDFSKQVVNKMRDQSLKIMNKLALDDSILKYELADVRDMKIFSNDNFDIILDKGCLDCLFCHDNFIKQVLKGLRQCYRILAPGGQLIIASHGKPKARLYLLRNKLVPFRVRWQKTKTCYIYICEKVEKESSQEQNEGEVIKQGEERQENEEKGGEGEKEQKNSLKQENQIQEAQYQFDQQ